MKNKEEAPIIAVLNGTYSKDIADYVSERNKISHPGSVTYPLFIEDNDNIDEWVEEVNRRTSELVKAHYERLNNQLKIQYNEY
jgi:hypothetical protein